MTEGNWLRPFDRGRDQRAWGVKVGVFWPLPKAGAAWHQISIDAKEGLAREAACFFLAGDESQAITFPIYDGVTGKQIATWKLTRLDVE